MLDIVTYYKDHPAVLSWSALSFSFCFSFLDDDFNVKPICGSMSL